MLHNDAHLTPGISILHSIQFGCAFRRSTEIPKSKLSNFKIFKNFPNIFRNFFKIFSKFEMIRMISWSNHY